MYTLAQRLVSLPALLSNPFVVLSFNLLNVGHHAQCLAECRWAH